MVVGWLVAAALGSQSYESAMHSYVRGGAFVMLNLRNERARPLEALRLDASQARQE